MRLSGRYEEEHLVSNESAKSHFRLAVSGLWNGERPAKWRTGSVKVSIAYMSLSLSGCGFDIDEGPRNEVFLSVASGIYIGPNTRPALTSDRIIFFA